MDKLRTEVAIILSNVTTKLRKSRAIVKHRTKGNLVTSKVIIIEQNALLKRLTQQTPSGRTGYRSTVVCYVTIKRQKEGAKKSPLQ